MWGSEYWWLDNSGLWGPSRIRGFPIGLSGLCCIALLQRYMLLHWPPTIISNLLKVSIPSSIFAPEGMLEYVNRIAGLSVVRGEKELKQVLCWETKIEHGHFGRCPLCETTEIHKVLRSQETYNTDNRNSIFSLTDRMHSQEDCQEF